MLKLGEEQGTISLEAMKKILQVTQMVEPTTSKEF
ncbi:hypothetical protein QN277_019092 [Acacia crassicarpa]|uniref:Uncharacterized protein n=1 Tax=Acacia crassicarpa TaxID=499986 RepID=A0AAE1JXW9_9FABA|nr:hypothetical protein QN277_019092 [Acacia crassicarpa]